MASVRIKYIVFIVSLEDLEWSVVGMLQRAAVSIVANVHIAGGRQVVGFVGGVTAVELMCGWKDGAHAVLKLAEKLRGHSQIPWLVRKELPRDTEGSAVHEIWGGAVWVFPPGCSDTEEYERQFVHPVWALEPSLEGSLQLAVKPFNETVGLRAVGRRVGG